MNKKNNWEKNKIGRVGKYLVAVELEKKGFSTALTLKNAEDFDILAIHSKTHKQVEIQVKTTKTKNNRWLLTPRCVDIHSDNLFYVFVKLDDDLKPEFHIVNSKIVAKSVKDAHDKWLNTPGKNGQVHKDNKVRIWCDKDDKYLDRWDDLS